MLGASILLLLLCFTVSSPIMADNEGTSTGTATVSSPAPSITSPELVDVDASDVNNSALAVNTQYHVNFTVSDANTLEDLDNVTVRVWLSGVATENDTDAEANHYTFTWVEATDTWSSSPSGFHIAANCSDPGIASSATSYEFRLAFDFSKVANYAATPNWKVSIFVWDDSENADYDKTLMAGVAFYSEISITDTTHAWTSLVPGSSNNVTVDGDADIDFTVISNANFDVESKGSGDLTKGGDTIALGNLLFHKDTLASAINMTTDYQDVGGLTAQSAPTAEASPTSAALQLWLTVPSGTPSGDYTYTLSVKVTQS